MIIYKEDWIIPLMFRLEGSVMVRASFFAVPAAIFAFVLVMFEEWYPEFREDYKLEELQKTQFWSASTFVLTILLGFRTNRAMARFWEGTGLLHQMRGEWFDSVSCCVTFSRAAMVQKRTEVLVFRHTLVRLMSLCHGSALEEIAGEHGEECHCIDSLGLDNHTLRYLEQCKHDHHFNRVEVLLHMIQSLITAALDDCVLKIPPPILSRVYQTLSRGFVNLLNAKKIADTRFPFPFVQLITMLLIMHMAVTPLLISACCKSRLWAPIFTFVPLFASFYLNFVGVELENPFGLDANDLPLDHFQAEMNKCLLMLLQEEADIIASVSSSRCETNFAELKGRMRPSTEADREVGFDSSPTQRKRLSNAPQYVDIYEEEDNSWERLAAKFLKNASPRVSALTQSRSRSLQELSPKLRPSKEIKKEESTREACAVPSVPEIAHSDTSSNIADAHENSSANLLVTATTPTTPEKSLRQDVLPKSMVDFHNALQDLKRSAEIQVQDLSRSISAVQDISDTLPMLLETISMGQATQVRHQAYAFKDRSVKTKPMMARTPQSDESAIKPLLPGPMTSVQIARVDRQDCPTVV